MADGRTHGLSRFYLRFRLSNAIVIVIVLHVLRYVRSAFVA